MKLDCARKFQKIGDTFPVLDSLVSFWFLPWLQKWKYDRPKNKRAAASRFFGPGPEKKAKHWTRIRPGSEKKTKCRTRARFNPVKSRLGSDRIQTQTQIRTRSDSDPSSVATGSGLFLPISDTLYVREEVMNQGFSSLLGMQQTQTFGVRHHWVWIWN
jgi:hypothetical protein